LEAACDWVVAESRFPDQEGLPAHIEPRAMHASVDGNGWYSERVLAHALLVNTPFRWHITPLHVNPDLLTFPCTAGAVVNQNSRHWVALRWDADGGRVCLLDSIAEGPVFLTWSGYVDFVNLWKEAYAVVNYDALG
jgi:hypothetical protein